MIPLRDVIPSRRAPWLTLALIAVSVSVFYATGHGWIATIASLVALWIFGDNVEDQLGRPRFLAIFALGGAAATGVAWWLVGEPALWSLALTGAIAGIAGAYLLLFPTSRVHILVAVPFYVDLVEAPALLLAAIWLFLQAVVSDPVFFLATMAGALVGAAAALALRPARDEYWTTVYDARREKRARAQ